MPICLQNIEEDMSPTIQMPPVVDADRRPSSVSTALIAECPVSTTNAISGASVLTSDANYKHTLALVRHLGRMGAHVSVVASFSGSLVSRSRYCRDVILASGASLEASVEAILQTVKARHFDIVMPVSFAMTLALARQRDDIAPYSHVELMTSDAIERAANKVEMTELAGKIGVPAPKTFVPSDATGLETQARGLTFPVVLKPQKESPGRSPIRYAQNLPELRNFLSELRREKAYVNGDPPLVQEFIPGYGCGFFASYQGGVCKRVFMHRRIREYPASGGISSCAESFYDAKLESYGRRMLDALEWHGVAMVEFRRDCRDGEYKLMEINPKFWGSLDLALAAGADFPGDLCQMALGRTLTFTDTYERGLRFQWPLAGYGDLFHLWTRPASFLEVALDFLNPRVKSSICLSDLRPNIQEFRGIVKQLFVRSKD